VVESKSDKPNPVSNPHPTLQKQTSASHDHAPWHAIWPHPPQIQYQYSYTTLLQHALLLLCACLLSSHVTETVDIFVKQPSAPLSSPLTLSHTVSLMHKSTHTGTGTALCRYRNPALVPCIPCSCCCRCCCCTVLPAPATRDLLLPEGLHLMQHCRTGEVGAACPPPSGSPCPPAQRN